LELANVSEKILKIVLNKNLFTKLRCLDFSFKRRNYDFRIIEDIIENVSHKKFLKIFRIYLRPIFDSEIVKVEELVTKLKYHPTLRYIKVVGPKC